VTPSEQESSVLGLNVEQFLFIGGMPVPAHDRSTFTTFNPATGKPLATLSNGGAEDIAEAVRAARQAFDIGPWPRLRASERGQVLNRIALSIRANADELARLECYDVGKPLKQAYGDVEAAARYFEFYGGLADKISGSTVPIADHILDIVLREPIGVSGQILPFNYPLQNTGRSAAPALAAGCTVVLKPSEEASLTPLRIARIAQECGLPDGVLNVVTGGGKAGSALSSHPDIDQVTFTGSVSTGIKVATAAAENIVPSVLELGGKSPSVVFGDADFERALPAVMASIFLNNAGQTCSAGSRLLLQRGAEGDAFLHSLIAHVKGLRMGPGIDDPDIGPVVSQTQKDKIVAVLQDAQNDGVKIHTGGQAAASRDLVDGYFIEPTIIEVTSNSERMAQEEVFGPVLTLVRFDTVEEALAIANDTPFGLSAYVWSRNIDQALYLAKRIRSGQVNVNSYDAGTGIEMPFGGFKKSGWGREKGIEGINSYLAVKNICIGISNVSDAV
jgi:aldehyde dehydrogenase (NAD+)